MITLPSRSKHQEETQFVLKTPDATTTPSRTSVPRQSVKENNEPTPSLDRSKATRTPDRTLLPFRGVENDNHAYLPLIPSFREIRYIAIDPGSENEPLLCFLGYTSLQGRNTQRKIPYEAVSYCWGNIGETVGIALRCARSKAAAAQSPHSLWTTQQYNVTRDPELLLRALRLRNTHRIRWVDAICIAQSDPEEKTHQVGYMSSIYSSASEVIVWLGEENASEFITTSCEFYKAHEWKRDVSLTRLCWSLTAEDKLGQIIVDRYGLCCGKRHEGSKWLLSATIVAGIIALTVKQFYSRPRFNRI
jgi:hypothetical protein